MTGRVPTAPGSRASTEPVASPVSAAGGFDPSRGRIVIVQRYTRSDIQANPDRLYVFGDNMTRLGRGGQAAECRGEPNAVGIVTKWYPTNDPVAFFCDADLEKVRWSIQDSFRRLAGHLEAGGTVVWPADGVGTGLARLHTRAPAIAAYIDRCFRHLRDSGSDRNGEDAAKTAAECEAAQSGPKGIAKTDPEAAA